MSKYLRSKTSASFISLLAGTLLLTQTVFAMVFVSKDHEEFSQKTATSKGASQGTQVQSKLYLPIIGYGVGSWPMAGANPERTSWTPEEVWGKLDPLWYKPFDAYIPPKVQIIASNGVIYISTSAGLYALDAMTGAEKWVYPTELPLGNSPTIYGGIAYVGGFDKKLHAIDASTGQGIWEFQAGAGFDTNPLVVNDKIFVGNRDGYFYAIHRNGVNVGKLAWKYKTGGPIHFSAAYKDGVVYFASNDSYAYALNAQTGALIWKSSKLPGAGFHSWWPVIYKNYVIFAGSNNYLTNSSLGPGSLPATEKPDIYPDHKTLSRGTLVGPLGTAAGDWAAGTPTINTSQSTVTSKGKTTAIAEYFEGKPWRRTYLVLDRFTGVEYTSDFDNDGKKEYAPILWVGTKGGGNRYPPVIAADNVLYQANNYMSDPSIPGGHISGWQLGTPFISVISSDWGAVDEPVAYSAGGNVIYWNLCCDRQTGAVDVSIPNNTFANRYKAGILPATGSIDSKREWVYFNYDIEDQIPGYNIKYFSSPTGTYDTFGSQNGIYGHHGDQNPPIPYQGKVYIHRSNAVIALAPNAGNPTQLPTAKIVTTQNGPDPDSVEHLEALLAGEVQKMLDAGHLRPGYSSTGIFDLRADFQCGDDLVDYWHHPGDTINILIQALPYLPADMQQATRQYIQDEFEEFPPYVYNHIGWVDGAAREAFILPPETEADRANLPPEMKNVLFSGWSYAPHSFYAMWKYAEEFGGAQTIFNLSSGKLPSPPSNSLLIEMPYVLNAYIAGYIGYLSLADLAGVPVPGGIESTLNNLLALRVSNFSKDGVAAYYQDPVMVYCRTLNASRNFMYMVPELGEYLHENALTKVQVAVNEYEMMAPYWFASKFEATLGEGVPAPFYDYHSIFQAKALILEESYDDLVKYLDVPAVAIGDLFYIQNLVTLLELGSQ